MDNFEQNNFNGNKFNMNSQNQETATQNLYGQSNSNNIQNQNSKMPYRNPYENLQNQGVVGQDSSALGADKNLQSNNEPTVRYQDGVNSNYIKLNGYNQYNGNNQQKAYEQSNNFQAQNYSGLNVYGNIKNSNRFNPYGSSPQFAQYQNYGTTPEQFAKQNYLRQRAFVRIPFILSAIGLITSFFFGIGIIFGIIGICLATQRIKTMPSQTLRWALFMGIIATAISAFYLLFIFIALITIPIGKLFVPITSSLLLFI